jgi:hypothetical protein
MEDTNIDTDRCCPGMEDVLKLIVEVRLLAARELFDEVMARKPSMPEAEQRALERDLDTYAVMISQMKRRSDQIRSVLNESRTDDDSWILGLTYLGVTTRYRHHREDGSISVRLEGLIDDLPLFEQCAVINEFDLFQEWIPFCAESKRLTKMGPSELVGYLRMSFTALSRDVCIHAYGCDCLQEDGKIVIVGRSAEAWPPTRCSEPSQQCEGNLATAKSHEAASNRSSEASSSGQRTTESCSLATEPAEFGDCDDDGGGDGGGDGGAAEGAFSSPEDVTAAEMMRELGKEYSTNSAQYGELSPLFS